MQANVAQAGHCSQLIASVKQNTGLTALHTSMFTDFELMLSLNISYCLISEYRYKAVCYQTSAELV